MKNASLGTLLVAICLAFHMLAVEAATSNPYSPAYDHPYRAGVIPTYETWVKMQAWHLLKTMFPRNVFTTKQLLST